MPAYIALIHKDPDTSYGVSFPDFPGCITGGDTLEEAIAEAPQVLAFHIAGMEKDGDAIPEPGDMQAIAADPENADALLMVVTPARRAGS